MKLVECVPNFSEGRDQNVLNEISQTIKSIKNVVLLDVDPGADTNRTVFTFVGEPNHTLEAAFQAIKKAAELIDMSKHKGEHPRMGATDVCPFVPVAGITMEECVELSKKLAKRVGEELKIPVYLYEYSASRPEWKNLANIRKGEYEALPAKMKDEKWKPDFGPQEFNARAGATAIGAREFLIAYNINLNTRDKKKAHDIALSIREKGRLKRDKNRKIVRDENGKKLRVPGLFQNCKAVGWYIDEYNRAQISMNLTNYKISPPHKVLEKVRELALEKGLVVTGSELVGLIPKEAMIQAGKYYLDAMDETTGIPEKMIIETAIQSMGLSELGPFDIYKKVIEYAIEDKDNLVNMTISDFADELSTDSPAPGGGSVAAVSAALSGALSAMVSNLTYNKKGYEKVWQQAKELADKGQEIKKQALYAVDKDTQAFYDMMDAMRLPKKSDEDKAKRAEAIQEATKQAILVPLETIEIAHQAVQVAKEIAAIGNENALSDAGVAAITANAGAKAAYLNIKINMPGIEDEKFKTDILGKAEKLCTQIEKSATETEKSIKDNI
jgi:glutamate formiminotransferase/formiminotetrahydrofolate cyclodeaminase